MALALEKPSILITISFSYNCFEFLLVEVLIPHLQNVNVTDRAGRTSLHHAAFNGHVGVCVGI